MRSMLYVALLSIPLTTSIGQADVVTYDFDSGAGPDWTIVNDGGLWTVDITGPAIEISKDDDDLTVAADGFIFGGIESAFTLVGDFTVTVDYGLPVFPMPTPGPSMMNESLLMLVEGTCFDVLRYRHSAGTNRIGYFDCAADSGYVETVSPLLDTQGRYRAVRTNSTISGYYAPLGSEDFTLLGSAPGFPGPMTIRLVAAQGTAVGPFRAHSALVISFDNLIIDGTLDPTSPAFVRGECNGIGAIDIADAIYLLNYFFLSATAPQCADACDVNDDGSLNIADAVLLLAALFEGLAPLPAPFPACGSDPTAADGLECESFLMCP